MYAGGISEPLTFFFPSSLPLSSLPVSISFSARAGLTLFTASSFRLFPSFRSFRSFRHLRFFLLVLLRSRLSDSPNPRIAFLPPLARQGMKLSTPTIFRTCLLALSSVSECSALPASRFILVRRYITLGGGTYLEGGSISPTLRYQASGIFSKGGCNDKYRIKVSFLPP